MSIEFQKLTGEKLFTHYDRVCQQFQQVKGFSIKWHELREKDQKIWNALAYDLDEEYTGERRGKIRGTTNTFVQKKPLFVKSTPSLK